MKTTSKVIIILFTLISLNFYANAKDVHGTKNLGLKRSDTTVKGFKRDPGWKATSVKEIKAYQKKYGITLFELQDKVTRFGNTAFFIQAPGNECYNRRQDCDRPNGEIQKRVEVGTDYGFKGNVWISYSFMLTDEFEYTKSIKSYLQLHSTESFFGPMFMLQIDKKKGLVWRHESGGGMIVIPGGNDDCSSGAGEKSDTSKRTFCEARHDWYSLVSGKDLKRNIWYDLVLNINFDKKDISKAFHKVWVNGILVHEKYNQTLWRDQKGVKENKANFKFGIYGHGADKSYQSLYVDEVHFGRKCKKLLLENLGYDCAKLEEQKIAESVPYMSEDRATYYTTGEILTTYN